MKKLTVFSQLMKFDASAALKCALLNEENRK